MLWTNQQLRTVKQQSDRIKNVTNLQSLFEVCSVLGTAASEGTELMCETAQVGNLRHAYLSPLPGTETCP